MKRFWSKVDKSGNCWEWLAGKNNSGYGAFGFNGRPEGAHRVAFMLSGKIIPNGMQVLHRCDNKSCVNPSHLFLGTQKDNMRDMLEKGRRVSNVPKGSNHPNAKLTESDVLYIRKETHISCGKISKIFDVSSGLIKIIRRREAWKHI